MLSGVSSGADLSLLRQFAIFEAPVEGVHVWSEELLAVLYGNFVFRIGNFPPLSIDCNLEGRLEHVAMTSA
jgi:hypothetical protein